MQHYAKKARKKKLNKFLFTYFEAEFQILSYLCESGATLAAYFSAVLIG